MDQTRVGRTGWLVLHCAAAGASRLGDHDAITAVDRVVVTMGGVFPCRRCREDIVPVWKAVRRGRAPGEDVRLTMVRFHKAVTQKVDALAGRPCSTDSAEALLARHGARYEALLQDGVAPAYIASFLFSTVMNCRGIAPNIQSDHRGITHAQAVQNFACRMVAFVEALAPPLGVTPPDKAPPATSCNQLHADWWRWVKEDLLGQGRACALFGGFDTMRASHLCTRVKSERFDRHSAPARFCGRFDCRGGCVMCDKALKKLW